LLPEIKALGYTGSMTHLQRFLNLWRRAHFAAEVGEPALQRAVITVNIQPHAIAPIAAAFLCIKPCGTLPPGQAKPASGCRGNVLNSQRCAGSQCGSAYPSGE